jgi:hypothetical protein
VETTAVPGVEKTIAAKEAGAVAKPETEIAKTAVKDTTKVSVEATAKESAITREAESAKASAVTTAAKEAAAREAAAKEAAAKEAAAKRTAELSKPGTATGKTKTEVPFGVPTKETGTRTTTTTGTKTSTTPLKTSTGRSLLDVNTLNLLASFADTEPDISEDSKNALQEVLVLANDRLSKSQYPVADNVVIADFYVPYLCCSDCAPIVYIFPPKETPPPEPAEFSIASTEYVFDDAHNYPFTAEPPVTDKNKAQVPFSSPDVLNPGNLNLLTDDANIMYLHPAMPICQRPQHRLSVIKTYR